MQCPYCLDNIPSSAMVCKSCRRDLQLVTRLQAHVAHLEAKLSEVELKAAAARGEAPFQLTPAPPSYRLETALAIAAAALLPAALFDLRIGFHLPAPVGLIIAVLASGAAGLLIGIHGQARKLTWIVLALLLAVLQVAALSIAFGCVVHAYYLGINSGVREAGRVLFHADSSGQESPFTWIGNALRNQHLWLSLAAPSLLLFVLLAFVGRSKAQKEHRSALAVSLGKRFTPRRPQEGHESFQVRLDAYTKVFNGLAHVIIVLLGIVSSYFVISHQVAGVTATDPIPMQDTANTGATATDSVPIQDAADK